MTAAFEKARLDWSSCYHEDRGDGVMILVPADELLDRIVAALRDHNAVHVREASMQPRIVLHSGQVERDAAGIAGLALNFAFRLPAAPVAKRVLHESTGIVAVVASDNFHEGVISQRPAAVPESYEPIRAEFDGFAGGAWLRLLGQLNARSAAEPPAVLGQFPGSGNGPGPGLAGRGQGTGVRRHRPTERSARRYCCPASAMPGKRSRSWRTSTRARTAFRPRWSTSMPWPPRWAVMTAWVEQQVRQMGIDEAFVERRREMARPVFAEQRLHLVISLEYDGIDPDRYVLSAWRQDDPEAWAPVRSDIREVRLADSTRWSTTWS